MQLCYFETKLPNLKLKNHPKQILGSPLLDFELPRRVSEGERNWVFIMI
jgi:hypothetical protein